MSRNVTLPGSGTGVHNKFETDKFEIRRQAASQTWEVSLASFAASLHCQADFDASDEEALPIAMAEKAAEGEPDAEAAKEGEAGEAKSASETNEASYIFAVADIKMIKLAHQALTTFWTCVFFSRLLARGRNS